MSLRAAAARSKLRAAPAPLTRRIAVAARRRGLVPLLLRVRSRFRRGGGAACNASRHATQTTTQQQSPALQAIWFSASAGSPHPELGETTGPATWPASLGKSTSTCAWTCRRAKSRPGLSGPDQRIAIRGPATDVDIHENQALALDDGGIDPCSCGQFVPNDSFDRGVCG